jgi:3-oxoadipate enol-lactonase
MSVFAISCESLAVMKKHTAQINGHRLSFASEGSENAPVVVLSHTLASAAEVWGYQLPVLRHRFRVILYDIRGHGESEATGDSYSLEELATDVVRLLDFLSIERAAFVGASLGGMIGQVLALTAPARLSALVLCATGSKADEGMQANFDERIETVRRKGMESQVQPTLGRWFSPEFLQSAPRTADWIADLIRATSPDGFVGCCRALQKLDVIGQLKEIRTPTLVVAGEKDQGFPLSVAQAIHERIEGSELQIVSGAAHLAIVEQAHRFNEILLPALLRSDDSTASQ